MNEDTLFEDIRWQEDEERHWEAGTVIHPPKPYGYWIRPNVGMMAIELREDGNRIWKVIHVDNDEECVIERNDVQLTLTVNDETDEWWHLTPRHKPDVRFLLGPFAVETLFGFEDITAEMAHFDAACPSHYRDPAVHQPWRFDRW